MAKERGFPDKTVLVGISNFKSLLVSGTDIHQRDEKGRTALFRVCRVGQFEKARLLLAAGADPNATDNNGEAPLQVAARYGHLACVSALLQGGAAINYCPPPSIRDRANDPYFDYSESALCSAVRKSPPAARLLLESGADPNTVTERKKYPLLAAIFRDDTDLVRLLLLHGALLKITDEHGRTPLHYAMQSREPNLIKVLLEAGADPDVKDGRGEPPIFEAVCRNGSANLLALRALLISKPNLSVRDPVHDMTPLELAIEIGENEAAKLIREAGAPAPRPKSDLNELDGILIENSAEKLWPQHKAFEADEEAILVIQDDGDGGLVGTAEDEDTIRRARQCVPSLLSCEGWRISRAHWRLLGAADKIQSLIRMAYFARGYLNRPTGSELEDGPEILGESYNTAVERFISEGLLRSAATAEAVASAFTTSELKVLLKQNNLRSTGSKLQLALLLCGSLPLKNFAHRIETSGGYYELTESGRQAVSAYPNYLAEVDLTLRNQILTSLADREIDKAVQSARILHLLLCRSMVRSTGHTDQLDASHLAVARAMLSSRLPFWLSGDAAWETRLRTILSAHALCSDSRDTWLTWDSAFDPPKTPKCKEVPLHELVIHLSRNGHSYSVWEWESELDPQENSD